MAMDNERIIGLIECATREVFSMMLGKEAIPGKAYEETSTTESFAGVVSLVGIGGPWAGIGTLYCGTDLALNLTGTMLMEPQTVVSDDVLDAMAELANMIVGNVKTVLEEELGALVLSIPTVIYGRNYKALNGMGKARVVVPFEVEGKAMCVKFCLVRQEETIGGRHSGIVHSLV
jgi:chemotaxis protein CheX